MITHAVCKCGKMMRQGKQDGVVQEKSDAH